MVVLNVNLNVLVKFTNFLFLNFNRIDQIQFFLIEKSDSALEVLD